MRRYLWLLACAAIVHSSAWAVTYDIDTTARVDTLYVDADGDSTNWAASSTPEWDMINENPHDTDVTYIQFSTTSTETYQMFQLTEFRVDGLVAVDSVAFVCNYKVTHSLAGGGHCWVAKYGSTWKDFDTIAATSSVVYLESKLVETLDPMTSGAWGPVALRSYQWGFHKTAATGNSLRYRRVTNALVIVYWRQETISGSIKTELRDNWLSGKANQVTGNYGGSTRLYVGDTATYDRRSMFWIDSTALSVLQYFVIDTARLYLKSLTVNPGTHAVGAYVSGCGSAPGTGTGSAQTYKSCWQQQWYNDEPSFPWQKAGCDSLYEDGGIDRSGTYQDSVLIAIPGWNNWLVTEWVNLALHFSLTQSYDAAMQEALLLKQFSEAAADSMVAFYSRDDATDSLRPYISFWGHQYILADTFLEVPQIHGNIDTLVQNGALNSAGRLQWSLIRRSTTGDSTRMARGGSDVASNSLQTGWRKVTAASSNHWTVGESHVVLTRFRDVLDTMWELCLCDDIADTSLVDSAIFYVTPYGVSGSWSTSNYAHASGPILQWWSQSIGSTFPPPPSNDSVCWALFQDSSWWRIAGARYSTTNINGDTVTDYNAAKTGTLNRDYDTSGYDRSNLSANDQHVQITSGMGTGGRRRFLNLTAMFKIAMVARASDPSGHGASLLDSLGFSFRTAYSNHPTTDSFTVADTSYWQYYAAGYATAASNPVLMIFVNRDKESRCLVESAGQIIIIGQRDDELGPPRYGRKSCPEY